MSYDWKISNLPKIGAIFIQSPALQILNHELGIRMFVSNKASTAEIDLYVENRGLDEINLETLSLFLIGTHDINFSIFQKYGVHFLPAKMYLVGNFPFDTAQSDFFSNGQIQIRFSAKLSGQHLLKSGSLRECQGRTSVLVDLERDWDTGNYHDAKLVKIFMIPGLGFTTYNF